MFKNVCSILFLCCRKSCDHFTKLISQFCTYSAGFQTCRGDGVAAYCSKAISQLHGSKEFESEMTGILATKEGNPNEADS